jgi:hypothetical protein
MVDPETIAVQSQEPDILSNALQSRPVMTVGDRVLSLYFAQEMGEQSEAIVAYAWTRLAVWLISRDSYRDVDAEAIVRMSLCSSLPYEAVLGMAEEFNRRGRMANGFVRDLLSENSLRQLKESENSRGLLPLAVAFTKHSTGKDARYGQQNSLARNLLVSAIHRSIFEITPEIFSDSEKLKASLREALLTQKCWFREDWIDDDLESSWGVRYEYSVVDYKKLQWKQTYLDMLASLGVPSKRAIRARELLKTDPKNKVYRDIARKTVPAGEALAIQLIDWQVDQLVADMFGDPQLRPFRSLSMDIAPPDEILEGSLANLAPALLESNIVLHAFAALFNKQQHLQGDVYDQIPVADDELALLTNIDGMPYHSSPAYTAADVRRFKSKNLQMLIDHYAKLARGAQHIIFPWDVAEGTPAQLQALDEIVFEFARKAPFGVDRRLFDFGTLKDWMSDVDEHIAKELSPIFKSGRSHCEALISRKPRNPAADCLAVFNNPSVDLTLVPDWSQPAKPEGASFEAAAYKRRVVDKIHDLYKAADFDEEIVVRPWGVEGGNPEQMRAIEDIAIELARRVHHGVDIRVFHRSSFNNPPSDDEYFVTIALTKPRESIVAVHKRAIDKQKRREASLSRAQTRGSPDPTR